MIISVEQGQLGNQLFQYSALCSLSQSRETIFLVGYRELSRFAETNRMVRLDIGLGRMRRILRATLVGLLKTLTLLRLCGTIEESDVSGRVAVRRSRGLFPIYVTLESFFQNAAFVDAGRDDIKVRDCHKVAAETILADFSEGQVILVHIRRGDYLTWPSREEAAVLPWSWYETGMALLASESDEPIFLFISDDPFYVRDLVGNRPDCMVVEATSEVSLALLSKTRRHVISASSFSWWGAELSRRTNSEVLSIAPKYWGGWRRGVWLPAHIFTPELFYLDVSKRFGCEGGVTAT